MTFDVMGHGESNGDTWECFCSEWESESMAMAEADRLNNIIPEESRHNYWYYVLEYVEPVVEEVGEE